MTKRTILKHKKTWINKEEPTLNIWFIAFMLTSISIYFINNEQGTIMYQIKLLTLIVGIFGFLIMAKLHEIGEKNK